MMTMRTQPSADNQPYSTELNVELSGGAFSGFKKKLRKLRMAESISEMGKVIGKGSLLSMSVTGRRL